MSNFKEALETLDKIEPLLGGMEFASVACEKAGTLTLGHITLHINENESGVQRVYANDTLVCCKKAVALAVTEAVVMLIADQTRRIIEDELNAFAPDEDDDEYKTLKL